MWYGYVMEEGGLKISLAAEKLGTLCGIPITNSLVAEIIVVTLLIGAAFFIGRRLKTVPSKTQSVVESILEFLFGQVESALGSRSVSLKVFPFLATLFIFIAACNLFAFLPIVGGLTFFHGGESIPLLRPANADLNTTLALAFIAVIAIEVLGVTTIGAFRYAGKFFTFKSPLAFTIGIIEFFSEVLRVVSFSFRLFGNILAGEILLAVAAFLVPYFLPVPFMAFEMFVAVVQGAVFAMLTLMFMKLAIAQPHESH